jgi:arylformamidase
MRTVWDISPPLGPATPVFPGDTPYSQQWVAQIGPGCPVNVSTLTLSAHLGAHADAPLHYSADVDPRPIAAVSLEPFLGPCRVIHAKKNPLIRPEHLRHAIDIADGGGAGEALPPRVLVRTYAKSPGAWDPQFAAFAPETIAWLASLGVRLVGIDTPSVDPADSKTLDSHQALLRHDMRVLENLVLDEIAPGDYELIALPLKLAHADASPVRAILRSL